MKKQKKNKIVFIIFGFSKKNLRSQPWYTVNKLSEKYVSKYDVNIFTDVNNNYSSKYNIIKIDKLFNFFFPTNELIKKIESLNPKKIFAVIGSHEILLFTRYKNFKNLNLIIGNNRFKINEILRVNFYDFLKEFKLLIIPIFASLIPGFFLRLGFNLIGNSKILYLSKEAQTRYSKLGLPKGNIFMPLKKIQCKKKIFSNLKNKKITLTYFGPPLNLRGLDIVMNAFESLSKIKKNIFLNLYVRNKKEVYLKNRMLNLEKKINKSNFKNKINLDTNYYSHKSLQKKIKQSTLIILPFKITISDTPIVIYEATYTKIPLFVLNTPGITENVKGTNSYICKNQKDLVNKILKYISE